MTTPTLLPIVLPVTQGSKENGFNSNIVYDANDESVAQLFGLPQSTTLEELRKYVASGAFNGAWADGAARADYVVKALNAFPVLVRALQAAQVALENSEPKMVHYLEPRERHAKAKMAVDTALAASGFGAPQEKRWGWSVGTNGSLCTSVGTFDLVADHPANQGSAEAVARYIADVVTLMHQLGGAGL